MLQRTLIILKPDAVQRKLVGKIIERFDDKGFKIVAMKMLYFTDSLIHDLYAHIEVRDIFPRFKKYITSGPVVALVLEREDAIKIARKMCGPTDPSDALPGTIRADYAKNLDNNIIHVADSIDSVEMEITLFFDKEEIFSYKRVLIDD